MPEFLDYLRYKRAVRCDTPVLAVIDVITSASNAITLKSARYTIKETCIFFGQFSLNLSFGLILY